MGVAIGLVKRGYKYGDTVKRSGAGLRPHDERRAVNGRLP